MSWVVDIVMAVIQLRDHLPWDNQHEQGILSPMFHSIFNTWLGPNVCPFRLIGDLSLALSGPWLLYRIASNGTSGISIETQILRLLVFVSRYLDVYFRAPISPYNTTLKWTILASSLILVSTLIGDKIRTGYGQVEKSYFKMAGVTTAKIAVQCIGPLALAFYINYQFTFMEVAWSFSQFLAAISDLPQFKTIIISGIAEWKLIVYLVLISSSRLFYIPHWILKYSTLHSLDPIAISAGIMTLQAHIIGFACLGFSLARRNRLNQSQDIIAVEKGVVEKGIVEKV